MPIPRVRVGPDRASEALPVPGPENASFQLTAHLRNLGSWCNSRRPFCPSLAGLHFGPARQVGGRTHTIPPRWRTRVGHIARGVSDRRRK